MDVTSPSIDDGRHPATSRIQPDHVGTIATGITFMVAEKPSIKSTHRQALLRDRYQHTRDTIAKREGRLGSSRNLSPKTDHYSQD